MGNNSSFSCSLAHSLTSLEKSKSLGNYVSSCSHECAMLVYSCSTDTHNVRNTQKTIFLSLFPASKIFPSQQLQEKTTFQWMCIRENRWNNVRTIFLFFLPIQLRRGETALAHNSNTQTDDSVVKWLTWLFEESERVTEALMKHAWLRRSQVREYLLGRCDASAWFSSVLLRKLSFSSKIKWHV